MFGIITYNINTIKYKAKKKISMSRAASELNLIPIIFILSRSNSLKPNSISKILSIFLISIYLRIKLHLRGAYKCPRAFPLIFGLSWLVRRN